MPPAPLVWKCSYDVAKWLGGVHRSNRYGDTLGSFPTVCAPDFVSRQMKALSPYFCFRHNGPLVLSFHAGGSFGSSRASGPLWHLCCPLLELAWSLLAFSWASLCHSGDRLRHSKASDSAVAMPVSIVAQSFAGTCGSFSSVLTMDKYRTRLMFHTGAAQPSEHRCPVRRRAQLPPASTRNRPIEQAPGLIETLAPTAQSLPKPELQYNAFWEECPVQNTGVIRLLSGQPLAAWMGTNATVYYKIWKDRRYTRTAKVHGNFLESAARMP